MSVVYPDQGMNPAPAPTPGQRIGQEVGDHPAFAAILVLGLALLIGFLVHKVLSGSSSSSSTNTSDANGPQTLYVPTSNTFETIDTFTNSNNTAPVNSPVTTTTTTNTSSTGTSSGGTTGGMLPPSNPAVFYTIKKGDTINSIEKAGMSLDPEHYWGETSLQKNNSVLSPYGFSTVLPSSLVGKQVQVGGAAPGGLLPNDPLAASSGIGSGGIATIRTSGGIPGWDDQQSGVPLHASPDGSSPIVGIAPYGSQVSLQHPEPQNGFYSADMGGMNVFLHAVDVVGMTL